jgi:tetratricopeptide (TPR) repeat protein
VEIKKKIIEKIDNEIKKGNYSEALKKIDGQIINDQKSIVLLELRALVYEKLQQYGKAINDYKSILKVDPNNKNAKTRTELLKTILRYSNTDIYASPNTNMDPWLE